MYEDCQPKDYCALRIKEVRKEEYVNDIVYYNLVLFELLLELKIHSVNYMYLTYIRCNACMHSVNYMYLTCSISHLGLVNV